MGKYDAWAGSDPDEEVEIVVTRGARTAEQPPQVRIVAPPADPRPVQTHAALPGVIRVQIPQFGEARRPIERIPLPPDGCSMVKGGQPEWSRVMATLPDLARQAGVEPPEVDAVRDLVSVPQFAAMSHWKETTRYVNGRTDATARGTFEGHVSERHQDSVASIRESRGTPRGTGPENL